jgi:hypothetical protein
VLSVPCQNEIEVEIEQIPGKYKPVEYLQTAGMV